MDIIEKSLNLSSNSAQRLLLDNRLTSPTSGFKASADAAETANGAVERMVLLGLTSRIIPNFVAMRSRRGRNQTAGCFARVNAILNFV